MLRAVIVLLSLVLMFPLTNNAQEYKYQFQNPEISLEERVNDLIGQMTLAEKVSQLMHTSAAIERLGIPEYGWWNECLHGVARNGRATIFPQAIGLAATFDTDLIHQIGKAISMEARAKYNLAIAHGQRDRYQGLTFWSPNVNIFRDPRWGRGQETYVEDPFLTSRIGVAFVQGLQGDHPEYLQAVGMAKHYAVHNGPEKLRHEFDAEVSMKDLWETYLPAFEALVTEANVEGVMGAYNRTNGLPCCAHPYLMQEILRKKWGFAGYFVSDCWALVDFHQGHKIVETAPQAAAMALNAGTNLNCGSTYPELLESVDQGLTTEATIDKNLRELLPTRFKLGLFDPVGTVPFDTIGASWIRAEKHVALSLEAAEKSIVLLKNEGATLPLDPATNSIFITGPTATHIQSLLANYYGVGEDLKTILEGIVANTSNHTKTTYSQGAMLDEVNRNPIDWFSGEASDADVTIACLGISQLLEGEEGESIMSRHLGDREDIGLPANQVEFLRKIKANSKKLIVVITSGSAIACPEVYEMADALLYAWYPGEQGGLAVGNVLFGKAVPSGRLPVTVPMSVEDLPPYEDYAMAGRTYRYATKKPLFPFGFGLSYSQFNYSELQLSSTTTMAGQSVTASITVRNEGKYPAEDVVQLYIKDIEASVPVPVQSLRAFQRVNLAPGASTSISFTIESADLEIVDLEGERQLEAGDFLITAGGSSPGERSLELGATQMQQAILKLKL